MDGKFLPPTAKQSDVLATLFRSGPFAVVVVDVEGIVEAWNPEAERVFGWRAEEVLGHPLPTLTDDGKRQHAAIRESVLEGRIVGPMSVTRRSRDGRDLPMTLWVCPLHNGEGQTVRLLGIFEDRSDQVAQEMALEEARRVELMLRESARIARAVPFFQAGSGLRFEGSVEDLLGPGTPHVWCLGDLHERLHPRDLRCFQRHAEAAAPGRNSSFECRVRHEDGGWCWTRWTLGLRDGQVVGLLQDIDAIHLLRDQLLHSQRINLLGSLAAEWAHEMKNHMAALLMASELVEDQALPPGSRRALGLVRQTASQSESLMRRLLDLSRHSESESSLLSPRHVLDEAADLLRPCLGCCQVLEVDAAPDLPRVWGAPELLVQTVLNLGLNARDALAPQGNLRLSAGLNEGDGRVWLEVQDDGCGMPEEIQKRIFEPFFTTKAKGKGTGLGLAVVRRVVSDLGGTIELQSAEGAGTRIRLSLPAEGSSQPGAMEGEKRSGRGAHPVALQEGPQAPGMGLLPGLEVGSEGLVP